MHDVAVVGAGCIGTSIAKHIAEAGHDVVVLEQEPRPAMHQSGRNSGVIHAGYNLEPGSNKARYCVQGSRMMRDYCRDRGVAMAQDGILVVATRPAQEAAIEGLLEQGRRNGVTVRDVDAKGIRELEPHAHGSRALHAPEGASVDSVGYVQAMQQDAEAAGARFRFGVRVQDMQDPKRIRTDQGDVSARVAVNAGGLEADRLAGSLACDMRIVPFRGYYAALPDAQSHLVKSHVYGAPDPEFPFLGVHVSRRVDGTVALGPGAILALGREAYRFWQGDVRDVVAMATWPGFWRLLTRPSFLTQVRRELPKSLRIKEVAKEARRLIPAISLRGIHHLRAGNRAQMVRRDGTLVEDIVVRDTEDSLHVLNAVSPGLTCSLPFGRDLGKQATDKL